MNLKALTKLGVIRHDLIVTLVRPSKELSDKMLNKIKDFRVISIKIKTRILMVRHGILSFRTYGR